MSNWMDVLLPLLPAGIVALTILVVMIAISLKRSYRLTAILSIAGLNAALLANIWQFVSFEAPSQVLGMFSIDGYALFNSAVVLIAALGCLTLSVGYFDDGNRTPDDENPLIAKTITQKEELYLLMLTATLGAVLMTSANHFASFFMALELLSVPMYGMLAYQFFRLRSLESGIKYLILSATASACLLMGMALIFAATGTLSFAQLQLGLMAGNISSLFMLGAVLMIAAMGFKLSLAPFHAWAGDVYQGAPAAVTAFLASVGKVAVMALAVRFFIQTAAPALLPVDGVLVAIIVLSVLTGNLLALHQTSLKRMLAFSSIAHMGYALMILVATGALADTVISLYMAVYALSSIGAFGVIVLMSRLTHSDDSNEVDDFSVYRGLFWRRPILTAVMTLMLLSMAGIPITAGFITKMQAMIAVVQGGRFGLALMLVVGSAIGLYYYLKVILMMYKRPDAIVPYDAQDEWAQKLGGLMLIIITLAIFLFGTLLPQLMIWLSSLAQIS